MPRPSITVYASSSDAIPARYAGVAHALGEGIARRGWRLVFGGGRHGLMGAVSRAARAAGGEVAAVILQDFVDKNLHCPDTRAMESVTDMRMRKRGLDELGDGYVALPGGFGTIEELAEIVSFKQLGLHCKPVVVLNAFGYWDPFLAQVERGFAEGFVQPQWRGLFDVAADAGAALALLDGALARQDPLAPSDGGA